MKEWLVEESNKFAIQNDPNKPLSLTKSELEQFIANSKRVWHKVYFDNWFNSPLLHVALWKQGFCSLGTVRLNRVSGCSMPSDTQMKKSGRGTSVIQVAEMDDVELRVVKWHDNRGVTLLSNFAALEPQNTVKRWDSKRKKRIDIKGKSIGTKRGRPSVDVEELYKEKAKRGPTVKIPAKPIRTDKYDHFPDFGEKKGRCKNPG
ncbi:hypothetical protein Pmani_038177 [Petrolisthes manimaculis]|uniref:PiggyBac transposable element-derived protein domain-containing protein n=1 Tax=Petrolisthes manimaculis TaxID=1843537 RepID=A0AAE1NEX8_9EUCA|nr:hypothetical protein Pmani_038177 [Petrolisthes manimaculis]